MISEDLISDTLHPTLGDCCDVALTVDSALHETLVVAVHAKL